MELSFFEHMVDNQSVKVICWTLVHSVWIGVLAAALAGCVLVATQKSSSGLRYNLLATCLVLFTLASGYVFYLESDTTPSFTGARSEFVFYQNTRAEVLAFHTLADDRDVIAQISNAIDHFSGWIVLIWVIFFVTKCIHLAGGLLYVEKIRKTRVLPVDAHWQALAQKLGQKIGITKTVRVSQSGIVKIPVTIGHFKPVILVPLGLILQLSSGQVETILLHELAHIRRRDYLVNLLQSLLETIFFFNPGVLWLSALIREQREICCDDIVLANTSFKTNYLEALLSFQTYDEQKGTPAMALSLRSNQLANRLKRIIYQKNKPISIMEKIVLLAGLLVISGFGYVSVTSQNDQENGFHNRIEKKVIGIEKQKVAKNEIIGHKEILNRETEVNQVMEIVEKMTKEVSVHAPDTIYKFKTIRFDHSNEDRANRTMTVKDSEDNLYDLEIVNSKLVALKINGSAIPETDLPKYTGLLSQVDQAWNDSQSSKQQFKKEQLSKSAAERQEYLNSLKASSKDVMDQKDRNWAKDNTNSNKNVNDWSKDREGFRKKDTKPLAVPNTTGVKQMPPKQDISADQARVRGVINELVNERVIANPQEIEWFGLSDDELIVNGKKQPAELQNRLKLQYNIRPGHGLYFGPVRMNGTGVFLDLEDLK
ncbi:M56 family metallopeptidase [Dyadobacter sp. CY323]|uniref:M56 family metallopeptidase n=1 Tax=Dyadobacter sp. CY323 TaxID=2907302 RepID=UPI001F2F0C63|nr:M56 family metallopeptidase [Dyadobacter sp. CY323]MCE6987964.1 M56 family metallopeptidase [Dyadobacter sp. CY323]